MLRACQGVPAAGGGGTHPHAWPHRPKQVVHTRRWVPTPFDLVPVAPRRLVRGAATGPGA